MHLWVGVKKNMKGLSAYTYINLYIWYIYYGYMVNLGWYRMMYTCEMWFLRPQMELGRVLSAIRSSSILPNGTPKTKASHKNWPQNMDAQNPRIRIPKFVLDFLPQESTRFFFILAFESILHRTKSCPILLLTRLKRRYKALSAVRQGAPSN